MQQTPAPNTDHYNDLINRQIEQYKETEVMHDLPPVFDYISGKYISAEIASVTGATSLPGFYAENFRKSLEATDCPWLISIGSGDCLIEIDVVKTLLATTKKKFHLICFELSPVLIDKARKKIAEERLDGLITVEQTDINVWKPEHPFAGVMANHSLHHFLHLESLFELIKSNLAENGRFVTCDMIGRNGHMRWPESLLLVRKIWEKLPRKYKYDHVRGKYHDYFENWDCSNEGFEGIRAQDILPLLVKYFHFEVFYGWGSLIDLFTDRGFGPNYNPSDPKDLAFIDYLYALNEKLLTDGILKPTIMSAVMIGKQPAASPTTYKQLDPVSSIRDPHAPAPEYAIEPLLKGIPYQLAPEDDPLIANSVRPYILGTKVIFNTQEIAEGTNKQSGTGYLAYGWSPPEEPYTWSYCEEAGLIFPLAEMTEKPTELQLKFMPYHSTVHEKSSVHILINGSPLKSFTFDNRTAPGIIGVTIPVPASFTCKRKTIAVTFLLPDRRQPQYEAGEDVRSLGIALMAARISYRKKEYTVFDRIKNLIRSFIFQKSS
jgi:hypothetical protein